MLQPIHVLRLSVAVLAVAIGVLWVRPTSTDDGVPRISTRWPKLEMEVRDGAPDLARVSVHFSRHGGLGMFPRYQVAITGTGGAAYRGERCVKLAGPVAFELDRHEVAALLNALDRIDFMRVAQRDVRFDGDTDDCQFTITMRIGDRQHTVTYVGSVVPHEARATTTRHDVEADLIQIGDEIDSICSIERYIGTEAERNNLDFFDVPEKYRIPWGR